MIIPNRQPPFAQVLWWARQDLNLRAIGYEPSALPLSYEPETNDFIRRKGALTISRQYGDTLVMRRNQETFIDLAKGVGPTSCKGPKRKQAFFADDWRNNAAQTQMAGKRTDQS